MISCFARGQNTLSLRVMQYIQSLFHMCYLCTHAGRHKDKYTLSRACRMCHRSDSCFQDQDCHILSFWSPWLSINHAQNQCAAPLASSTCGWDHTHAHRDTHTHTVTSQDKIPLFGQQQWQPHSEADNNRCALHQCFSSDGSWPKNGSGLLRPQTEGKTMLNAINNTIQLTI